MNRCLSLLFAAALLASAPAALAHTVSNSYLTLEAASGSTTTFHGQWDISLRDLQFVVGLDDNGDGKITWGELQRHQKQIAKFAYSHLALEAGGKTCTVRPKKQRVDTHADGAYAVLFFTARCPKARTLDLDDRLLFEIDPTHRGIFVFRAGGATSTAMLSPANHAIELKLPAASG